MESWGPEDSVYRKAVGRAADNLGDELSQSSSGREILDSYLEEKGVEKGFEVYSNSLVTYSAYENRLDTALARSLNDKETSNAVRDSERSEELTVGVEYELPTRAGESLLINEIGKDILYNQDYEGNKLFSQEDAPITVELQTMKHRSPRAAVLELFQRIKLVEEFSGYELIEQDYGSGRFYPGIHVHVGFDGEEETFERISKGFYEDLDFAGLVSANSPGMFRDEYVVSVRQRGMVEDNNEKFVRKGVDKPTIEYRIPDVNVDFEDVYAVVSMIVGIDGFYRNIRSSEKREGQKGSETRLVRALSGGVSENDGLENFVRRVSSGLESYGLPDDSISRIEELYRSKRSETLSDLDTKLY